METFASQWKAARAAKKSAADAAGRKGANADMANAAIGAGLAAAQGLTGILDTSLQLYRGNEAAAANAQSAIDDIAAERGRQYSDFSSLAGGYSSLDRGFDIKDGSLGPTDGDIAKGSLKGAMSGAQAGMQIGGPWGAAIGAAVGGLGSLAGGLFGKGKAETLEAQMEAEARLQAGNVREHLNAEAERMTGDQFGSLMANVAAAGGRVSPARRGTFAEEAKARHMTVQRFADRVLSRGRRLAEGGETGNTHDMDRYSHGAYMAQQPGLVKVGAGGTHEGNPAGGVRMGADAQGVPNLVEEGEEIYDGYVFSNRLKAGRAELEAAGLPGKYAGMKFSDIADKLGEEAEDRPNDPVSGAGMGAMLDRLEECQEAHKARVRERRLRAALDGMTPQELLSLGAAMGQAQQAQQAVPQQPAQEAAMAQAAQAPGAYAQPPAMACGGRLFDDGGPTLVWNADGTAAYAKGSQPEYTTGSDGMPAYNPGYDPYGYESFDPAKVALNPYYVGQLDPAVVTADSPELAGFKEGVRSAIGAFPGQAVSVANAATGGFVPYLAATDALQNGDYGGAALNGVLATAPLLARLKSLNPASWFAKGARYGHDESTAFGRFWSRHQPKSKFGKGVLRVLTTKGAKEPVKETLKKANAEVDAAKKALDEANAKYAETYNKAHSQYGRLNSEKVSMSEAKKDAISKKWKAAENDAKYEIDKAKKAYGSAKLKRDAKVAGSAAVSYGATLPGVAVAGGSAVLPFQWNNWFGDNMPEADDDVISSLPDIYFDDTSEDGTAQYALGGRLAHVYDGSSEETNRMDDGDIKQAVVTADKEPPKLINHNAVGTADTVESSDPYKRFWHGVSMSPQEEQDKWRAIVNSERFGKLGDYGSIPTNGKMLDLAWDRRLGPVHSMGDYYANLMREPLPQPGFDGRAGYDARLGGTYTPPANAPAIPDLGVPEAGEVDPSVLEGMQSDIDARLAGISNPDVTTSNPDVTTGGGPDGGDGADGGGGAADVERPLYTTLPRYAGAAQNAIGTLATVLQRPDYTLMDGYNAMAARLPLPQVRYGQSPIRLAYRPQDSREAMDRAQAESAATRRAALNSGLGMAAPSALAALGTSAGNALGSAWASARAANDNARAQNAQYVNDIDAKNANGLLSAASKNANYLNERGWEAATLRSAALKAYDDEVTARANAISDNSTNLANNLSAIGDENFRMNQINNNRALLGYGTDHSGRTWYVPQGREGRYGGTLLRAPKKRAVTKGR